MTIKSSTIGGALLVAGTSIGGGMLALPVMTSLGGFFPSLVIYVLCWAFMACTGLLFLEISLWMDKSANIVTMAEKTLGSLGKIAAWGIYLFLFYCLTIAYIVGCGDLVVQIFQDKIPVWAEGWFGPVIFLLLFAPFVYAGTWVVSRLNIFLMLGLGISFLAFVVLGTPHVQTKLLFYQDWPLSLVALPIAFTSFAYQGIIPTLVQYLDHDASQVRKAILMGSFLPLLTYAIWQWLILGIVPTYGPGGLAEAMQNGSNAIQPLKHFIDSPMVYVVGQYFAFFALVTSFFGVTLGLMDFLADGLKVKKTPLGKLILCALIFIPPLLIAFRDPKIFLIALDYAGGFGCALLLGLMPVLMVWSGRYKKGWSSAYALPGGRLVLILLSAFVLFEVGLEIYLNFNK